ncbi:MAG: hypothetical protein NDJ89_12935 [Oligoflexia bacterium]|nr:hypothetical protein [Oligoflexia bacterium]
MVTILPLLSLICAFALGAPRITVDARSAASFQAHEHDAIGKAERSDVSERERYRHRHSSSEPEHEHSGTGNTVASVFSGMDLARISAFTLLSPPVPVRAPALNRIQGSNLGPHLPSLFRPPIA